MSQIPEYDKQPQEVKSNEAKSILDNQLTGESIAIPVIEEQIQIGKQVIETGKVLIEKKVFEEEKTIDIPLMHDEHTVERIPLNQYVEAAPAMRYEGDTMIIPVLREEVVIQKRLVLVEELRITKRQIETSDSHQVTLRREEIIVDRTGNTDETNIGIKPKDTNTY